MMTQPTVNREDAVWLANFITLVIEQVAAMTLSDAQVQSLSPLALAYIGDAVYELFVRSYHLVPPKRIQTYHNQVVNQVRAEQQAHYLELLRPYLTEAEEDITRRGRNAASNRKSRAGIRDYQQATALEALVGYLYLKDPRRLMEILSYLPLGKEESQEPMV